MNHMIRGIRGAITVEKNSAVLILNATKTLLKAIVKENEIKKEDIASVIFSMTPDLNAVFPAEAARSLGWSYVPLLGCTEAHVPQGLPRCIRVLMHVNTTKTQEDIKYIYLGLAKGLRQDILSDD